MKENKIEVTRKCDNGKPEPVNLEENQELKCIVETLEKALSIYETEQDITYEFNLFFSKKRTTENKVNYIISHKSAPAFLCKEFQLLQKIVKEMTNPINGAFLLNALNDEGKVIFKARCDLRC